MACFLLMNNFFRFKKYSFCHRMYLFSQCTHESKVSVKVPHYLSGSDCVTVGIVQESFHLYKNFVSENEEIELMKEIEPLLKRRRYEIDHWDGAITVYKETEKLEWNVKNNQVLQRLREIAFPSTCSQIKHVHVLDLAKKGHIKPHIDSIRFCGDTIAGISLLSTSVMRLAMEKNCHKFVDVLLPKRSLYVMKGSARYDFTHEILEESRSFFNGKPVPRDRRISIICRNEPKQVVSSQQK